MSIAGADWVLLLVSRGYTLVQVGLAETYFHLGSICAEITSGIFADVAGQKKSLAFSCAAGMILALVMALRNSFTGACVSIGFSALSVQPVLRY